MSRKSIGEIFDYTRHHSQAPELTDRVVEHYFAAGELAGKTVLDAGCRVGDHSSALLRKGARRVVGVDLSAQCLAEARRRFTGIDALEFLQRDIADLGSFADSSFDVAYCTGTMTFLAPGQARRALRELVRVTRPGGIVLVLFLRDRGTLPRIATWIADRLPLRLYRLLVEALGGWLRPLAPWVLGRQVGVSFLKNDVLWSLQGSHYGVPVALPDELLVETIRCEFCSPETTVSYRIPVPEDKRLLELGPAPAG